MVCLTAAAVTIVATGGAATPVLLQSATFGLSAGGGATGVAAGAGVGAATTVAASSAAGGIAGTIAASGAGSVAVTATGEQTLIMKSNIAESIGIELLFDIRLHDISYPSYNSLVVYSRGKRRNFE